MSAPDFTPGFMLERRRVRRDRAVVLGASIASAVVAGAAVSVGLIDAVGSWDRAEAIRARAESDAVNAFALRDEARSRLATLRGRALAQERARSAADWGRYFAYLAQVAKDRCVITEIEASDRAEHRAPAHLTSLIRGQANSRRDLLGMIAEMEGSGAFSTVRLIRFVDDEGSFEIRLEINRAEVAP